MELASQGQSKSMDPSTLGFDLTSGEHWIYPQNYPVRDYQFNIVSNALYENTLVCLPTGLGKTFIAAVVMYNFWRWYPHGKVVFLAPTRPLVAQQIHACHDIMKIPKDQTQELTGQMNPKNRQIAWFKKRVIFATPQVFQNDLEKKIAPAELVKCVVIDEAHKALGKHAYSESLRVLNTHNKYFRVLALSATPGSKLQDVNQVIQNLYISHLELRDETSTDIVPYLNKRKMDIVLVDLDDDLARFKERYIHIMDRHVKMLIKYNVLKGETSNNITKGRIHFLKKEFQGRQIKCGNHNQIMHTLNICLSMFHAYELMIRHGLRAYYNFYRSHSNGYYWMKNEHLLQELLEEIGSFLGPFPNVEPLPDGSIPEIPENIVFGHTKFYKLRELLLQHFMSFEKQKKETRAIVFVEYRDSVNEVYVLLLQSRPLLRPQMFVGQAGQKQRQQMHAMQQFRSNKSNVLISTSVGEEGLDVGEVDLIVCFDVSQRSPIRLVQRMGRTGRKRDGHIIILVTDGKEHQTLKSTIARRDSLNNKVLKSSNIVSALYQESPRMVPPIFTPECRMQHFAAQPKTPAAKDRKANDRKTSKSSPTKENNSKANSKKSVSQTDADKGKSNQPSMLKFLTKANSDKNPSAILPSCSPDIHEIHPTSNTLKPDKAKLLTCDDAAHEFLTLWVIKTSKMDAIRNESDEIDMSYFPAPLLDNLDNFPNYQVPSLAVLDCLTTLEKEEEMAVEADENDDGFHDDIALDPFDMQFPEMNQERQPEDDELEAQEWRFENLLNDSSDSDRTIFLEDEETRNSNPELDYSKFEALVSEDSDEFTHLMKENDAEFEMPGLFETILDECSDESNVEKNDSGAEIDVGVLNERLDDSIAMEFEDDLGDSSNNSTVNINIHEKQINEPSTSHANDNGFNKTNQILNPMSSPILTSSVSQISKKNKFLETVNPLERSRILDDDEIPAKKKRLSLKRLDHKTAMEFEDRKSRSKGGFENLLSDSSDNSTGNIDIPEEYINEPSTSYANNNRADKTNRTMNPLSNPILTSSIFQTSNMKEKFMGTMDSHERSRISDNNEIYPNTKEFSSKRTDDKTAMEFEDRISRSEGGFENLLSDSSDNSTGNIDIPEEYINEPSTSYANNNRADKTNRTMNPLSSPILTSSIFQTSNMKEKFMDTMDSHERSRISDDNEIYPKTKKLSSKRTDDKTAMEFEDRKPRSKGGFENLLSDSSDNSTGNIDIPEEYINEPSTSYANNNRAEKTNRTINPLSSPILTSSIFQTSNMKEKFMGTIDSHERSRISDDNEIYPKTKKLSSKRTDDKTAMEFEDRISRSEGGFENLLSDSSDNSTGNIDIPEEYINEPSTSYANNNRADKTNRTMNPLSSPILTSSIFQTSNMKEKFMDTIDSHERSRISDDNEIYAETKKLSSKRTYDKTAMEFEQEKFESEGFFEGLLSDSSNDSTVTIDIPEKHINEPSTSQAKDNESDKTKQRLHHMHSPILTSPESQSSSNMRNKLVETVNPLGRSRNFDDNQTSAKPNKFSSNSNYTSMDLGTSIVTSPFFNSTSYYDSKTGNSAKPQLSKIRGSRNVSRDSSCSAKISSEEVNPNTKNGSVQNSANNVKDKWSSAAKYTDKNVENNSRNDSMLSVTQVIDLVQIMDMRKNSSTLTESSTTTKSLQSDVKTATKEPTTIANYSSSENYRSNKCAAEKSSEDDIFAVEEDVVDLTGIHWDEEFEPKDSSATDIEKSKSSAKPAETSQASIICIDLTDDEYKDEPEVVENEWKIHKIGKLRKMASPVQTAGIAEVKEKVSKSDTEFNFEDYEWDSDFETPANPVESIKYFQGSEKKPVEVAANDTSRVSVSKPSKLAALRNRTATNEINLSITKNRSPMPGTSNQTICTYEDFDDEFLINNTDKEKLKKLEKRFFGSGNNSETYYALVPNESPVKLKLGQLSLRGKENVLPKLLTGSLSRFAAPSKYRDRKKELADYEKRAAERKKTSSVDRIARKRKKNKNARRRDRIRSEFLDYEAEVESDVDTSEGSSGTDKDLENFVSYTQEVPETVDMHAHYMQSIRSPVKRPGGFLFKEPKCLEPDINIYSQPQNFDEPSTYLYDSFCVEADEDDEVEDLHNYSLLEQAERRLKKRKRRRYDDSAETTKKRKVIERQSDDSSEDETETLRRQIQDESLQLRNEPN